jgi:hypothetical protein
VSTPSANPASAAGEGLRLSTKSDPEAAGPEVEGGEAFPAVSLRKQETFFPTVYTRPNTGPAKLGQAVFTANLIYMSALNAADYFTTRAALRHDGMVEANPIMRPFVENDIAFTAVKAGLSLSSFFILKNLYKKNKALAWVASLAANAALSYIVVNNLKLIRDARSGSVCQ